MFDVEHCYVQEGTEKDSTNAPVKPSASTTSSGIVVLDGSGEGTPGGMPSTVALRPTIVLSDSDNDEKSSSDSDFEAVTVRRRKVPVPTFNIETRLKMMGYSVPQLLLVSLVVYYDNVEESVFGYTVNRKHNYMTRIAE